jgi:hypothetical protein
MFVKFKISKYLEQSIDERDSKQPKIPQKIPTSLWILKISRKISLSKSLNTFAQIFAISNKENT